MKQLNSLSKYFKWCQVNLRKELCEERCGKKHNDKPKQEEKRNVIISTNHSGKDLQSQNQNQIKLRLPQELQKVKQQLSPFRDDLIFYAAPPLSKKKILNKGEKKKEKDKAFCTPNGCELRQTCFREKYLYYRLIITLRISEGIQELVINTRS